MTDEPPWDEEQLAGILHGHLRYAIAQQQRFESGGQTPPITEDSDHNRFLWVRIRYPGFFRHVAREMEKPVHQDRIEAIVTAAATSALRERPTLGDWAVAMGEDTRNSRIARYQQRVVTEYLPDVVRLDAGKAPEDKRMRAFATSFDAIPGQGLPEGPGMTFNPDSWKRAPTAKFRDINDWVSVSSALLCAYPEQLRVWLATARAVVKTARRLEATSAANTITSPLAVSILANHAASICADSWWSGRSAERQRELLETPRTFDYSEEAAREAGKLWLDLAATDPRWSTFGFHMLQYAALGLQRWGAAGQAGALLQVASAMNGMTERLKGAMLSDAGYAFRTAGRLAEAVAVYEEALTLLDRSDDVYHRVIIRVNLCEALGGPAGNPRASGLLHDAMHMAGTDSRALGGFWRNCATMFHRLKLTLREEACLNELLAYPGAMPDGGLVLNERLLELHRQNHGQRPLDRAAALGQ